MKNQPIQESVLSYFVAGVVAATTANSFILLLYISSLASAVHFIV